MPGHFPTMHWTAPVTLSTGDGDDGGLAPPLAALVELLANSSTFQTLVGVANATAAKQSIHRQGLPKPADGRRHTREELEDYRPYAVVYTDPEDGYQAVADGVNSDGFAFWETGDLVLRIERDATDEDGDEPTSEDNENWHTTVGQIIDDLKGLAGQGGYLAATAIRLINGISWNAPNTVHATGLFQSATIAVSWGGE